MQFGTLSASLAVKHIAKSKQFYEVLGFTALPSCDLSWGKIADHGKSGHSQWGEDNFLTLNPKGVRGIEVHLRQNGIAIETAVEDESGPDHCIVSDPDGNVIMFDPF